MITPLRFCLTIFDVKQTYATNNNEDNLDYRKSEYSMNSKLFLEALLLMIRGNTIKYSSCKKKQQQPQEIQLVQEIKIIEDEVNANFINMSDEI